MVLFIPKKAIYTAALAVVLVTLAAVAPRPPQAASAAAGGVCRRARYACGVPDHTGAGCRSRRYGRRSNRCGGA